MKEMATLSKSVLMEAWNKDTVTEKFAYTGGQKQGVTAWTTRIGHKLVLR
jgi:hypothetical protein